MMVTVTLKFEMPEEDFRAYLAGDARPGFDKGITVESIASRLLKFHDPVHGYIEWKIER